MDLINPDLQPSAPNSEPPNPEPPKKHRFRFAEVAGIGAVFIALLTIGVVPRWQRQAELTASAKAVATQEIAVNIVKPHRAALNASVTLPGTIQAIKDTTIYARTDGYLRQRFVDIGDRVREGQLLAEIESPEVDRELSQGRANLAQTRAALLQAIANKEQAKASLLQAQANSQFATRSWERWQDLNEKGAVSQQDTDEKKTAYRAGQATANAAQAAINANQASVESAQANVKASEANVQRLEALQSFQHITAPFAGIITFRDVDAGALITSGSSTNNRGLFKLAQIDTLRVYTNIPQTFVGSIRVGIPAKILLREFPKQVFTGQVARTTDSLDASSHTLLTEIHVSNPEGKLLPGMYAQVEFVLNRTNPPLLVPASALVSRSEGQQVAIVRGDRKVHYQKVEVGRDYGSEVEIISGLQGDEALVVNPTDAVAEGKVVRVSTAKK